MECDQAFSSLGAWSLSLQWSVPRVFSGAQALSSWCELSDQPHLLLCLNPTDPTPDREEVEVNDLCFLSARSSCLSSVCIPVCMTDEHINYTLPALNPDWSRHCKLGALISYSVVKPSIYTCLKPIAVWWFFSDVVIRLKCQMGLLLIYCVCLSVSPLYLQEVCYKTQNYEKLN